MNSSKLKDKKAFLFPCLIFLLAFFSILFHLGTPGLFETSEGRYASVARAMVDRGDYIVPVHNGLKHLTKPPVTYWAGAIGIKLFGVNEFGVRFLLAMAAAFTALGCYLIGKHLFNEKCALAGSIILICSLFFQFQFRGFTTDPYLTMFETFMVFGFLRFLQTFGQRNNRRWELFFWFMASMSMLTKGPPGLLPLVGLIPFAIYTKRKAEILKLFKSVPGLMIFLFVGLGWYLVLAIKTPGLLSYFLIDETLKRVASDSHHRSAPFYLFLLLLPAGIFPWTTFLFSNLKKIYQDKDKSFASLFLLFWLIGPLIIFTLSKSKLPAYGLPLLVPVALLATASIERFFFSCKMTDAMKFHINFNAILLLILGIALAAYGFSGKLVSENLNSSLIFVGLFWSLISICLFASNFFYNRMLVFALLAFVAPGFIFFSIPGIKGNEELTPGKYLPSEWLLLRRIGNLPPEQKIVNVEEMIEGWYFYTGRNPITWNVNRITRFDSTDAARLVIQGPEQLKNTVDTQTMMVIRKKDLAKVSDVLDYNLKTIASEGKWLVVMPERRIGPQ
ncbi:MAG: hypothetical protein Kow0029_28170 [Candidatus Rifleibacteriota bacterium]